MEYIMLTRCTLHSNIHLNLSVVWLVHSDSGNVYTDEVWCVQVLQFLNVYTQQNRMKQTL